jgi:hypothetical protein
MAGSPRRGTSYGGGKVGRKKLIQGERKMRERKTHSVPMEEAVAARSVRLRFDLDNADLLGENVLDSLNEDGVREERAELATDNADIVAKECGSSSFAESDFSALANGEQYEVAALQYCLRTLTDDGFVALSLLEKRVSLRLFRQRRRGDLPRQDSRYR